MPAQGPFPVSAGRGPFHVDDVDSLSRQLDRTQPDDPAFNDLTEKLQSAEADCNAR